MKSGENCSRGFREEDILNLKIHNFIHVYSLGTILDISQGTKV